MKSFVTTFCFLYCVVASAQCPDLDGKYKCKDNSHVSIKSVLMGGVKTYKINGNIFRADGVPTIREFTSPRGNSAVEKTVISCKNSEMIKVISQQDVHQAAPYLRATYTYRLDAFNDLEKIYIMESGDFGNLEFFDSCMREEN